MNTVMRLILTVYQEHIFFLQISDKRQIGYFLQKAHIASPIVIVSVLNPEKKNPSRYINSICNTKQMLTYLDINIQSMYLIWQMTPHVLECPDSYVYIPEAYRMSTIHKSGKDLVVQLQIFQKWQYQQAVQVVFLVNPFVFDPKEQIVLGMASLKKK